MFDYSTKYMTWNMFGVVYIVLTASSIVQADVISTFKPVRINTFEVAKSEFIIKISHKHYHLKLTEDEYSNHWTSISVNNVALEPRQLGIGCNMVGYIHGYPSSTAHIDICDGMNGVLTISNNSFIISPKEFKDYNDLNDEHVIKIGDEIKEIFKCGVKDEHILTHTIKQDMNNAYKMEQNDIVPGDTRIIELSVFIPYMTYKAGGIWKKDYNETIYTVQRVSFLTGQYFRYVGIIMLLMHVSIVTHETDRTIRNLDIHSTFKEVLGGSSDARAHLNKFGLSFDLTVLLSPFSHNGYSGMAYLGGICQKSEAGSLFCSCYMYGQCKTSLAHEIGHTLNLNHFDLTSQKDCSCYGGQCIMGQYMIYRDHDQARFSNCEGTMMQQYINTVAGCIKTIPSRDKVFQKEYCGDLTVNNDEQCDCGFPHECHSNENRKCCNPLTCKYTDGSNCMSGVCCKDCMISDKQTICESPSNECLLGKCDGTMQICVIQGPKPNGESCMDGKGKCDKSVCYPFEQVCYFYDNYTETNPDINYQLFTKFSSQDQICSNISKSMQMFKECENESYSCSKFLCDKMNNTEAKEKFTFIIFKDKSLVNCDENTENCSENGIVWFISQCGTDENCWIATCEHQIRVCGKYKNAKECDLLIEHNAKYDMKKTTIAILFVSPIINTILIISIRIYRFKKIILGKIQKEAPKNG